MRLFLKLEFGFGESMLSWSLREERHGPIRKVVTVTAVTVLQPEFPVHQKFSIPYPKKHKK